MSSFYGGGGGLSKKDLDAITSKIFKFKIVTSLPTEDISDSTIYLINTGEEEDNFYTEYVYVDNNWEKFGTQKVDLSNYVISQDLTLALETKVDKDGNKVLTDINYSAAEQEKVNAAYEIRHSHDNKTALDSITAQKIQQWNNAEQNVNADWNANGGDAQILNKPDLTVYALADDMTTALAGKVDKEINKSLMSADEHTKLNNIEAGAQVNTVTGVKGNAENDYRTGEINISPANIGLGNVDNTSDANKPISTATQTALDGKQNVLTFDNSPTENSDNPVKSGGVYSALAGKISTSAKGANGGVAELDANGKVPSSQLPSYVDDVLSYNSASAFPATGEDGKIYIAKDTNLSYRWAGSDYGVISPSLALGDTSSTAYRGDWGAEDRAAIGTLTDLQTSAKSSLVAAVNEVKNALGGVQGALTFDNVPTSGSENPVKSGGIYTALAGKQDTLTIDSAPTSGSENPVESGGVYTALSGKQNTLTFDSTPTENSTNPVTSGGVYNALAGKQNSLTIDSSPTASSTNPVTSGGVYTALAKKQNTLVAGNNITFTITPDMSVVISTDDYYQCESLYLSRTGTLISPTDQIIIDDIPSSDRYCVEIYYQQTPAATSHYETVNGELVNIAPCGIGIAKGVLINNASINNFQLTRWEYDSANTSLAVISDQATFTRIGNTNSYYLGTLSESFTIYNVIGYTGGIGGGVSIL